MNAAANMMQSVDIDAFFGLCDEMSLGAVQAVKQANGKQLVFSFDGNPNAAEAVKSGDLMCTLSIGRSEDRRGVRQHDRQDPQGRNC